MANMRATATGLLAAAGVNVLFLIIKQVPLDWCMFEAGFMDLEWLDGAVLLHSHRHLLSMARSLSKDGTVVACSMLSASVCMLCVWRL